MKTIKIFVIVLFLFFLFIIIGEVFYLSFILPEKNKKTIIKTPTLTPSLAPAYSPFVLRMKKLEPFFNKKHLKSLISTLSFEGQVLEVNKIPKTTTFPYYSKPVNVVATLVINTELGKTTYEFTNFDLDKIRVVELDENENMKNINFEDLKTNDIIFFEISTDLTKDPIDNIVSCLITKFPSEE